MKIKDIDFEKYEIFSDGKIWSKMFNRYKKTQIVRGGYLGTMLVCKDGKSHPFKIHRIIAELFCKIPKHLDKIPIEELDVDHINGNRVDNSSQNLRWCTRKENSNYELTKLRRKESHLNTIVPNRWKKVLQYTTDGELINEYESLSIASKITNISSSAICNCIKGKSKTSGGYIWKHK